MYGVQLPTPDFIKTIDEVESLLRVRDMFPNSRLGVSYRAFVHHCSNHVYAYSLLTA